MAEVEPLPETLSGRAGRLFAAYRSGDHATMGNLVELLTPILWQTARSQRLDAAAAEDAVQTAWLALLNHADSIREPNAVLGWLIMTTRREAWRLSKAANRVSLVEPTDDITFAAQAAATEDIVISNDEDADLWRHVRQLPARCQELLRVIAFADRPDYVAVAGALGMPVGSIGPTRGRCLAKLRAQLAADPRWEGSHGSR